jgi:hypothetical protein
MGNGMDQRIPLQIQPIIDTFVRLIELELPEFMSSFYVLGSIALDGFNEKFSDIDFVAMLNRNASALDIEKIGEIHKRIRREYPRWKMSGIYIQEKDVGKYEDEIEPHPYYHDGKIHAAGYFEINSITWWILKNRGIKIKGVDPQELAYEVDWDLLIRRMRENLNTYWSSWTRRIDGSLVMLTDWGIQWTVLGVLRQYYTFQENTITTKEKAAEYGLDQLPNCWQPLIQEAVNIRTGQDDRNYRCKVKRMADNVKFLKYVIQKSNDLIL